MDFLHFSVRGSSPHQQSQTRLIPQAALRAPARACRHAMPADHACRFRTPGQPSGPRCYYNRVSVSLCLYLIHCVFLRQSCSLLSSLQSRCLINLSVGQSCIHFISPLISNYPYQYPKSHNLGFHQYPLYYTKIKPNQLTLNLSSPYNQTVLFYQSKHHAHN